MSNNMYADNYVETLTKETKAKYSFQAKNIKELKEWQDEFRQELIEVLGINQIKKRSKCELNPTLINKEELKDHIREEWTINSEPGYKVPFYVLRPLKQKDPLPLVLTPHGHGKAGKDTYVGIAHNQQEEESIKEGERDIALQAVKEGYIAIALDQRGFAKTKFKKDIEADKNNSCRTMQMHALLFGRTLIGERVWDITRLIDYAENRDDIDINKVALTGNSGGGTTSLFAAALEPRIKVAIPSSYFCTFADSIAAIHHCECNYIPGIMTLGEMYDVAGLIAPRALLVVAGKTDPIFPIAGVKKAFAKAKKVYQVAEIEDKCELYIGEGGHRYYKKRVWSFVKENFAEEKDLLT